MTFLGTNLQDFATLAIYIAVGLLLGMALDHLLRIRLLAAMRDRFWKGWPAVMDGLKRMPTWWLGLTGAALALERLSWSARAEMIIGKGLLVFAGITVTVAATRIAADLVRLYAQSSSDAAGSSTIFVNLTRIVVVLLGGLLILNALSISITPILTALGVGGLAVALALQDTLSNLFGGIQIVASKQVRPGDLLELDSGKTGYVEDITWRYTTLHTLGNNRVIVPNALLSKAVITNYALPDSQLSVIVGVGVAYGSDLDLVEQVTTQVAREAMAHYDADLTDFEPWVTFTAFGDSSINLNVGLRTRTPADQYSLRSEFIKRLNARYAAEGIEIPYPHRVVQTIS